MSESVRRGLIIGIRIYQSSISPKLSRHVRCRFYPTCSQYALECLQIYDLLTALRKIFSRLSRCRPDNWSSCIDLP